MSVLKIKAGDTTRAITDTLTLDGSAIDLTGATVVLVWREKYAVQRKSATVTDAEAGEVSYTPTSDDVATPKVVNLEWEITFSDSTVLTVPTDGPIVLRVMSDLG